MEEFNIIYYEDDIIHPYEPQHIIIPNTYIYDRIVHYINNALYYDNNQITNIQYYRMIDFLHQFR